ncbi:hypothetical protein DID88_002302 [Monilinia fructigena]|uniref:Integrase catalytic domain-containing protein n=1 Tax=Monilinia fructigena TaxID=38457 RepID=A0A395IIH1_9HELO|nr:hypothetical protein DID88_002302 [Monilinia fructigena]
MYFTPENDENNKIIKATMKDGMYIISHVKPGYEDSAFFALSAEIIDGTKGEVEELTMTEKERYLIWHRRFNHLGPDKIRNLHKVTTLQRPIKVPSTLDVCEVCALTKMTNRIPSQLSARKSKRLELIHFDIAGPFPRTIRGHRYFLLIIDSATRVNWVILLKQKSDTIPLLKAWKQEIELATGVAVIAARTDNAPELLQAVREWKTGMRSEVTVVASSHQNGPAERNIRAAETDIRAMLKEAHLPLEFWDEAVEHDVYIRNRTSIGPDANGIDRSPLEAFTGTLPDIDTCKVWGSRCYAYINPKTIPKGQRHDKLRDTARVGIFLGYSKDTTKHIKVYSPELGYTYRSYRVTIDESYKGGDLDLKLRNCVAGSQGTKNIEPNRRPRGRPKNVPESSSIPVDPPISPNEIITDSIEVRLPIPKRTKTEIPRFDEDEHGNIRQVIDDLTRPAGENNKESDVTLPDITSPPDHTPPKSRGSI